MSLADNALLTSHSLGQTVARGMIDADAARSMASDVAAAFDVRLQVKIPGLGPVWGNLQKFVVGREITNYGLHCLTAHMGR